MTCGTCKHLHRLDEVRAECRRFPPQRDGFTLARMQDWCGEYTEAVEPTKRPGRPRKDVTAE
jgi:hypothetical protein